ncbi:uncharacterized protein LOC142222432 [Haematobia irritans]|uniref:Putative secreted protein n=1 Tax=Haematobia irritans TaxID=7368 RepID=A0A1L8E990_HAEIR
MLSSKFFILMVAIVSMLVFSAPVAEGTFLFLACLLRSPFCPLRPPANGQGSGAGGNPGAGAGANPGPGAGANPGAGGGANPGAGGGAYPGAGGP